MVILKSTWPNSSESVTVDHYNVLISVQIYGMICGVLFTIGYCNKIKSFRMYFYGHILNKIHSVTAYFISVCVHLYDFDIYIEVH